MQCLAILKTINPRENKTIKVNPYRIKHWSDHRRHNFGFIVKILTFLTATIYIVLGKVSCSAKLTKKQSVEKSMLSHELSRSIKN